MAKKKPSALETLARLNDERRALEDRAAEAKRAAALELGMVVLDAGGAAISPPKLRELIGLAAVAGIDTALQRLGAKSEGPPPAAKTKAAGSEPAEVQHG